MGRFDSLTQLEKKEEKRTPLVRKDTTEQPKYSADLLANQQTSKEASQQRSESVNQQASKEAKKQTSLLANQQASKSVKKFGSYLTEESLKRLKRLAFETDRKDYEVLQEAVDLFLAAKKIDH